MEKLYYTAKEVAEMLDVSVSHAYKVIREANRELSSKGFYVRAGRVSRKAKVTADFKNPKGFFPSKVFCDTNQVNATGIPKYLRNAPSIMLKGGSSPKRITTNSDTTNQAI